jgi:hypothetical protein
MNENLTKIERVGNIYANSNNTSMYLLLKRIDQTERYDAVDLFSGKILWFNAASIETCSSWKLISCKV